MNICYSTSGDPGDRKLMGVAVAVKIVFETKIIQVANTSTGK